MILLTPSDSHQNAALRHRRRFDGDQNPATESVAVRDARIDIADPGGEAAPATEGLVTAESNWSAPKLISDPIL